MRVGLCPFVTETAMQKDVDSLPMAKPEADSQLGIRYDQRAQTFYVWCRSLVVSSEGHGTLLHYV